MMFNSGLINTVVKSNIFNVEQLTAIDTIHSGCQVFVTHGILRDQVIRGALSSLTVHVVINLIMNMFSCD